MKFLIITKMRQTSVDIWAKLLPAHFKYLDALENKKTVEVSYHLIGHQGDVLIVNADSDEQLARVVGEDPLFFYTEREIYPLTTREVHKRRLEEIFGKATAHTRTS
ncbi:MAG TPA: YciI family protein [Candidatus Acidoferrales bacterium]|nr:YciI family protein [Candidatus Acidoferrales bacterium]